MRLTEPMLAAIICERYGWTWDEYQDQPMPFLATIYEKIRAEGDVSAHKARQPGKIN